jgi:Dyp-type peroxidase family
MFKSKYYATVRAAQRNKQPEDAFPPFDLNEIGADTWRNRFKVWLFGAIFPPLLFLFRELWPVARIGSFVLVSRDKDVRHVLAHPEQFEVPFGREMKELAGDENFVLGLEGGEHDEQNSRIRTVLGEKSWQAQRCRELETDPDAKADHDLLRACLGRHDAELIARMSNGVAKALIRTSGGRIDVMKDYITRIAAETCIRYFGLKVEDADAFAEWAMAISTLLFADPCGDPATRRLALNGAARVRHVIDRSIHDIKKQRKDSPDDDVSGTVLGRLVLVQERDPTVTDAKIRAILVGLVTGFIPTNTLAAGKILQELLRRPAAMREAMAMACRARHADEGGGQKTGKLELPERLELQAVLLEAARFNPALAPGQWRYAKETASIGTATIPKGATVIVSTMSALRDRRSVTRPGWFKPDRPAPASELLFGTGAHECLGKHLALAQITELFMVLLSQENLRRRKTSWGWWGGIKWVGPFPRWLDMDFEPSVAPGLQTMVTVCAPLRGNREDIGRQIAALDNPAEPGMRRMLDETGIVHFASLSVIEAGDEKHPAPHLLLEMNVDGSREAAFEVLANCAAGRRLEAIFKNTPMGEVPLDEVLNHYALDLQTRPWGATGLNFAGTSEFPVADIDLQDQLAAFAKAGLKSFMRDHAKFGSRAMQALQYVRKLIYNIRMREAADGFAIPSSVTASCETLADYLIVPSRKQLRISDWEERSKTEAVLDFTKSCTFWRFALLLAAVDLLLSAAIFFAVGPTGHGLPGRLLLAATGGLAATILLAGLVIAAFLALLYYHDLHDIPDDRDPSLSEIRKIARTEDPPGFVQNHFMAVTDLKRGWFRRLTLALSLWGIKLMVLHLFRPGFVLDMGTIHYAKWFRVPRHDKLIFQANYDGSWESYLEDFIMKAHQGQTAAWSNGVGFPRTSFLINDGAQDGDRFKRWVRRQQVLAPFWYSRFPKLTTDQIRNNALIHDGLARASTESEARAWLDCFGSMPRPDYAIESTEVQALVFSAERHLYCVKYALLRLPRNDKAACLKWLESLVPGAPHGGESTGDYGPDAITFGDHMFPANSKPTQSAVFVGFTAQGLAALGLHGPDKRDGLATFPATFNMGMANRGRSLGDEQVSPSTTWHWTDARIDGREENDGESAKAADAVLLIYAKTPDQCESILNQHVKLLGDHRKRIVIHEIATEPLAERIIYHDGDAAVGPAPAAEGADKAYEKRDMLRHEHFGFRDGISQPVIRGTKRFSKHPPPRDVVEPGEFILGYRNNQGYYPPTASVRAESDRPNHLPTVLQEVPSRFPSFEETSAAARDFGRNGSFLVIRQLEQHIDQFKEFLDNSVAAIQKEYQGLENATGSPVTAEWVAAKMMGRWPNGVPLVERPEASEGPFRRKSERDNNDFSYGRDDPQGLSCPFGAHIRRANPRDSMQPEDPSQQEITNRHRLLRRGRTYSYLPPGKDRIEKGLLFACLCADLDRQFEFVQQTWINSPSFHGLRDEPDPMVGWHSGQSHFTIPTASGPVQLKGFGNFVTVRAGGYFFLPSRSALRHLADLNRSA